MTRITLQTVILLLYIVTLTFDIWTWSLYIYRLWRDETLYQTWTLLSNPRRSYCQLNIWS